MSGKPMSEFKLKKLTDEEKLDIIIEHLTGVIDGGYPGECMWIGNTLAYTGSRGGSFSDLKYDSTLGAITRRNMLKWVNHALAFCEREGWPDDDISDALYETEHVIMTRKEKAAAKLERKRQQAASEKDRSIIPAIRLDMTRSDEDIATQLGVHRGRVKYLRETEALGLDQRTAIMIEIERDPKVSNGDLCKHFDLPDHFSGAIKYLRYQIERNKRVAAQKTKEAADKAADKEKGIIGWRTQTIRVPVIHKPGPPTRAP
jgi:hypothetical protein